jgi:hypothetical protein
MVTGMTNPVKYNDTCIILSIQTSYLRCNNLCAVTLNGILESDNKVKLNN